RATAASPHTGTSPNTRAAGPRTPPQRVLANAHVAQQDVVVGAGLIVSDIAANPVNGHGVVRPDGRLLRVPEDPLQVFVLPLAHLGVRDAGLPDELLHGGIVIPVQPRRARF